MLSSNDQALKRLYSAHDDSHQQRDPSMLIVRKSQDRGYAVMLERESKITLAKGGDAAVPVFDLAA